jgi:hypothetical protein
MIKANELEKSPEVGGKKGFIGSHPSIPLELKLPQR